MSENKVHYFVCEGLDDEDRCKQRFWAWKLKYYPKDNVKILSCRKANVVKYITLKGD